MDAKTLTFYTNGKISPYGIAFYNLPDQKMHFYFSGANGDNFEIINQRCYIQDVPGFFSQLEEFFKYSEKNVGKSKF